MHFNQVIGQKHIKEQLVQMIRQNRLSHALLFLGKEGTGGLPLALAFAQYLVCEKVNQPNKKTNSAPPESSLFDSPATAVSPDASLPENSSFPEENIDSCGVCPACVKSAKFIHPDIHYSYPIITTKKSDKPTSKDFIIQWRSFLNEQPYGNNYDWLQFIEAENKQGNITANECSEIGRNMSLKSFESGYKVLIMWMPEFLGNQGNKLLKLIEEPPPNTLFIFVAENDKLILPTICSRLQLIKLAPLSTNEIEAALELREGISVPKAMQVAAVSQGNYHEALAQLQHADNDWQTLLRDWMNTIIKTGPAAQVEWIEEVAKLGREKQKQFLNYFNHLLEQAIKLSIMGIAEEMGNVSESQAAIRDFALRLNKLCDLSQQEAIIHEIDQAAYFIERNANGKLLFHALTIKLYHIISNKSVILIQ